MSKKFLIMRNSRQFLVALFITLTGIHAQLNDTGNHSAVSSHTGKPQEGQNPL